jgi:ABC-type antimicrobial peptide transport system permease subunit
MEETKISATISWILCLLVSLAVGSSMISETLTVPLLPTAVSITLGWALLLGVVVSLMMAIFKNK